MDEFSLYINKSFHCVIANRWRVSSLGSKSVWRLRCGDTYDHRDMYFFITTRDVIVVSFVDH